MNKNPLFYGDTPKYRHLQQVITIQKKSKVILLAVSVCVFIISAGCIDFDRHSDQPMDTIATCSESLISGEDMILNETQNNTIVCLKNGSSFTLQLNERTRVGHAWNLSGSQSLEIRDNGISWFDESGNKTSLRAGPGKEVHEWTITAQKIGVISLKGYEKYFSGEITGNEKVFNLTIVVE
ncbi:MAG TPA: hypothetical protein HA272_09640 [Methanoregula sp.]|nr:hypothetical protein [Methanoregula sp.]